MPRSSWSQRTRRVNRGSKAKPSRSDSFDFRGPGRRHETRSSGRRNSRGDCDLMKRRDLEKKLRVAGCYLKREGGSHSLWTNPRTGVVEALPRHTEIKEPLAWKILKS